MYQRCPSLPWLTAAVLAAGALGCTEPNPAFRKAGLSRGDGAAAGPDIVSQTPPPPSDADPVGARETGSGDQPPADPTDTLPPDTGTPPPPPDSGSVETPPSPDDAALPDTAAPPQDPRTTQDLLAAFPFEQAPGNFASGTDYAESDASGNGYRTYGLAFVDDVPVGAPANTKSLQFDGVAGYATLTFSANPLNDAPKTIAVWFKSITSTPRLRTLVVLATRNRETTNLGIQLGFDGDKLAAWRYGQNPEVSGTAARGTWQHGAYTYSGNAAGTHTLYVNGVQVATVNNKPMLKNQDGTSIPLDRAMLGTYDTSSLDEMFKGMIKDLRIYNRALSETEIRALASRP